MQLTAAAVTPPAEHAARRPAGAADAAAADADVSPLTIFERIVALIRKASKKEQRTEEQLREHYEVEKRLANRLRNATRDERRKLYTSLYDELYRCIPHHPLLTRKKSPERQREEVQDQMKFLSTLLHQDKSFLEVGAGDCALAFNVANIAKEVYAVDVSNKITEALSTPNNFVLLISDGCSIPVPKNSIDIIYSNQLMEHIHPDDAYEQLRNILEALVPGGSYLCITPNRLSGPHDISMYFDTVAASFHLKEYTITELTALFKSVGFSKVMIYMNVMGKYIRFPVFPAILCERVLERLPNRLCHMLANLELIGRLIKIRILGVKPDEIKAPD